ncbi:MAG: Gfo/Idh/MocA family oxidoreductase [Phycisphaerales bacterium]|nr:Gfo/Idh/MocA family oxidoreductase [Phycisphaerales bacterium]
MLQLALIGCGEHASLFHAPPLGKIARERPNDVQLVAAVDLNIARARALCNDFGFKKAYADYRQMLAQEKPDAVVLVMPVPLIASVSEEFLSKGIPCVVEKPIGANITEARRLVEVAGRTGTPHMVSVNRRFLPPLNKAKEWVSQQGKLRFLRANMLRYNRTEPGFVWETGVHLVDAIRHVAGDIEDLSLRTSGGEARSQKPEARRGEIENQKSKVENQFSIVWYAASLQFKSGAQGSFEIQTSTGIAEETYDFLGDNFRAKLVTQQNGQSSLQCWKNRELVHEETTTSTDPAFITRGEYAETTEFINALLAKRAPRPSLADILPSAEICHRLLIRDKVTK